MESDTESDRQGHRQTDIGTYKHKEKDKYMHTYTE